MRAPAIVIALVVLAAGASAGALDHSCREVPGLGFACAEGSLLRVPLADGSSLLTHGGDPVPGHGGTTFADPIPPACVEDPLAELHGLAIYARAVNDEDRSATLADDVAEMVARANGMLRHEAASYGRVLDYRMACDAAGNLRVDTVTLPTPIELTTFQTVANDLRAQGYVSALAKYWIFFDGRPPNSPGGTGSFAGDERAGPENVNNWGPSYGVTWGFLGRGGAKIMMHENGHNLGAVPLSAPNTSGAGHCNDGWDVMCYADGGPRSDYNGTVCVVQRFDCGGNDYFNPTPAENSYLAESWNLGSPFNRAMQGCSFSTGLLAAGDPVMSTARVSIDESCEGRWYAGMAFTPAAPVSTDPSASGWQNTSPMLPDVDVCWYDGATSLGCDESGRTSTGAVPDGATAAEISLRLGATATFVLSIV